MSNLLTPRQAAEQMRISISTIYQQLNRGWLVGAFKDENGRWQIPEDAVPETSSSAELPHQDVDSHYPAGSPSSDAPWETVRAGGELTPAQREAIRERNRRIALAELYAAQEKERQTVSLESLYRQEENDEQDEYSDLYAQGRLNREVELERYYAAEQLDEQDEDDGEDVEGFDSEADDDPAGIIDRALYSEDERVALNDPYEDDSLDDETELDSVYIEEELESEEALSNLYASKMRDRDAAIEEFFARSERAREAALEEIYNPHAEDDGELEQDTPAVQQAGDRKRSGDAFSPIIVLGAAEKELDESHEKGARGEPSAMPDNYVMDYAPIEEERSETRAAIEVTALVAVEDGGAAGSHQSAKENGVAKDDGEIAGDEVGDGVDGSDEPPSSIAAFLDGGGEWLKRHQLLVTISGTVVVTLIVLTSLAYFTTAGLGSFEQTGDRFPTVAPQKVVPAEPSATVHAFAPQRVGESLIVIPTFYNAEADSVIQETLREAIASEAERRGMNHVRVEVEPETLSANQRTEVAKLGETYEADMVIWGEETGGDVIVDFLSLAEPAEPQTNALYANNTVADSTRIVNPSAYSNFMVDNIETQLPFLALMAIGYVQYMDGDYMNAAATIRDAIESVDALSEQPIGLADAYFRLGWLQQMQQVGHEQALESYRNAIRVQPREAAALNNIGVIYDRLGETEQALEQFEQVLALRRQARDGAGEAIALNNVGALQAAMGNGALALEYFEEALGLLRESGDMAGEAAALNSMGDVYHSLGQTDEALQMYGLALPLLQDMGDKMNEAITHSNIGRVYSNNGDKTSALDNYNRALMLMREDGDAAGEAVMVGQIGLVHDDFGDNDLALEYYSEALSLLRSTGNTTGEALVLSNMGAIYNEMGDRQQALAYYNRVLPLTMEAGDRSNEAITRFNIAMIHKDLGELDMAEEQMIKVVTLDKEMGHPELGNDLAELEAIQSMRSSALTPRPLRHR